MIERWAPSRQFASGQLAALWRQSLVNQVKGVSPSVWLTPGLLEELRDCATKSSLQGLRGVPMHVLEHRCAGCPAEPDR